MNGGLLFFFCFTIAVLLGIILYQQYTFHQGTQARLGELHHTLGKILDGDSREQVMVFTENPKLKELAAQINRLLERQRKIQADYRRSELASKRMLSNISHDMKTPMTVVLGYLEIMRLNGQAAPEMLEKTEQKAQSVLELINQFFTLAKIEAGDLVTEPPPRKKAL